MPLTLLFNKDESCVYFPIFVISNSPIGHWIHISKFILNYIHYTANILKDILHT